MLLEYEMIDLFIKEHGSKTFYEAAHVAAVCEEIVRKNVKKGAAFLDVVDPGWEDKINIPRLNMNSYTSCICGQLFMNQMDEDHFSGYDYFVSRYGNELAPDYGFNLSSEFWTLANNDFEFEAWGWEILALEWIKTIEKRRANK